MNFPTNSVFQFGKYGSGIRTVVIVGMLAFIFAAWFGWNSFEQSRTLWMEAKVINALDQSMQSLSSTLPRIQVTDSNSGEVFYAPDLNAPLHAFDLYAQTLINLNQDMSVPTVKLFNTTISEYYGPSDTTLQSQTTVEFPLIVGIDKIIVVQSSIQIPHFRTAN